MRAEAERELNIYCPACERSSSFMSLPGSSGGKHLIIRDQGLQVHVQLSLNSSNMLPCTPCTMDGLLRPSFTSKLNRSIGHHRLHLEQTPPFVKQVTYITFVSSTLEYASSIWSTRQEHLISELGFVQNTASRFVN